MAVALNLHQVKIRKAQLIAQVIVIYGAGRGTRTPDILITNQALYQLS
jgi:hypothetical protein